MAAEDKDDYYTKTAADAEFLTSNLGSENAGKTLVVGDTGDIEVSETEYLTEENTFGNDGVETVTSELSSVILHSTSNNNFDRRNVVNSAPFAPKNQERIAEKCLKTLKIWLWEGGNTHEEFKIFLFNLPNKTDNRVLSTTDLSNQFGSLSAWKSGLKLFITLDTSTCPEGENTFKLDGTDSRVTINSDYVKNGCAYIPNRYYIAMVERDETITTSDATVGVYRQFKYGAPNDGSAVEGFVFFSTSGSATQSTSYNLPIEFTSLAGYEEETKVEYNFDEKLKSNPVTYKKPKQVTFSAEYQYGTNRGAQGGVYYLEDISAMNGKYLTHIGVRPGAGVHPIVIRYAKCATAGKLTGGTTYSALVNGGTTLCTINAPAVGMGQTKPMIFALDGSDDRVTISQEAMADYNSEQGGFLVDGTWAIGLDDRANSSNISTPNATNTGDGALGEATVTFIGTGASAKPVSYTGNLKFGTANVTTGSFGTPGNSDLCLELFTSEEVSQEVNSNIIQGILDQLSADFQEESPLKDKYITIVGDSISTWDGWNNVAPMNPSAAVYYPKSQYGMTDVHQSYWMKLVDRTGAKLLCNQSWSGSRVTNTGSGPICAAIDSSYERTARCGKNGINPDYIVINMGTNDFDYMGRVSGTTVVPTGMGTWNGRGNTKYMDINLTPITFREAYAVMLGRLKKNYPLAKIFCCTVPCGDAATGTPGDGTFDEINHAGVSLAEFNDAIREVAVAYGCRVVELALSGLNFYTLSTLYCDNRLHPNEAGMELYYAAIRHALEKEETTAGTPLANTSVKLLQGDAKPIVPEFEGTDIAELKAELNRLLVALESRGVLSTDESKYVTINSYKFRVVNDIKEMTLTDNATFFYTNTKTAGTKRYYYYGGGRCAPMIDNYISSSEDGVNGFVLAVNGGETITYNPSSTLTSEISSFAYSFVEFDSTGAVPENGSYASSWYTENKTLQSSTKYVVILFRTNATLNLYTTTTAAQKKLMLESLTIA